MSRPAAASGAPEIAVGGGKAEVRAGVAVPASIDRGLVRLLAVASCVSVANLYYNQPLLARIAASFHVPAAAVGAVPTLSQFGYATGLALIVPLGDLVARRRLVSTLLALVSVALVCAALAPTLTLLILASYAIGVTTVVPQVLVPYAAQLAPPAERGRTVGTVISGILLGILLSRAASGLVAQAFGWRTIFWVGAGLMIALAIVLRLRLPAGTPSARMGYGALLRSVLVLAREQRVLREAALSGALLFGSFSVFWATLAFHLASPTFRLGEREAGLFGLIGAVGALAAPIAGRHADKHSARFLVGIASAITLASFGVFFAGGQTLAGLIAGVILLDLGVQAGQVSNQTRIYAIAPEMASRINTFYMTSYFIGGATGSLLGALGWSRAGWPGVCAAGALLSGLALAWNAWASVRERG